MELYIIYTYILAKETAMKLHVFVELIFGAKL